MEHSKEDLLSKIKVLEEENIALSEKVEYSFILNIIAKSTDSTENVSQIIDSVLEKICILKQLPFAALFSLNGKEHKLENSSHLYGKSLVSEREFRIPETILRESDEEGYVFVENSSFDNFGLSHVKAYPQIRNLLFYRFTSKFFPEAILVFIDSDEDSQLPSLIYLFEQVITYLVERLDKLYYWTELQKLNNELEERVAERTAELETANSTLEAKEKFIRSIYEAAQNVSFITVRQEEGLVIDSFSPGAARLFAYLPEEVVGKPLSILLHEDAIKNLGLFESGFRTKNVEVQLRRKSGEIFYAMHNSYPSYDESGKLSSELLVCTDISDLKMIQDQLIEARNAAEKADSLKTIFLQNMSHEIRTPLNAIVGFSDLLNNPDLDPEGTIEYTGIISRSSSQLLSLVNDILDIASIESGQYEIRFEEVNMRQMLISLNLQFGPVARQKELDFILDFPAASSDMLVESDFIKLQQVLINLVGNAIKFTEKGFVKLSCSKEEGEVIISVSDSGAGIASENHTIIFDRFRQIDLSSVRSTRGTGLGLYICKTYMDLLGGRIWVESTLGIGSTFNISIPVSGEEKKIGSEREESNPHVAVSSGLSILVVEDEDTNFMLMEVYLNDMDIQISRAYNGLEAVSLLKQNQYDLVLMDIQMPVMNGLDATRQIREFNQDIPVIAVTAFAFEKERKLALEAGCNEHLSKPIKKEVLEQTILEFVPGTNLLKFPKGV